MEQSWRQVEGSVRNTSIMDINSGYNNSFVGNPNRS